MTMSKTIPGPATFMRIVYLYKKSAFQSNVNRLLKLVSHESDMWEGLFSPRTTIYNHVLRSFSVVTNLGA